MKNWFFFSLLFLLSCQQDNPQPNTNPSISGDTTVVETSLPCENIPWNQNVTYGSVSDIDGNSYKTVQIGNQEWMAENLKTTHYSNGDEINFVFNGDLSVDNEWMNIQTGAYCWYLDIDNNGDTVNYKDCYGGLYNAYVVIDNRNTCPTGWHVPSDDEWTTLELYLNNNGYSYKEGFALLSSETGDYLDGYDSYGFRGVLSGTRNQFSNFFNGHNTSYFWSSSEYSQIRFWGRELNYSVGTILKSNHTKNSGLSIRCVKD